MPSIPSRWSAALAGVALGFAAVSADAKPPPRELSADELRELAEKAEPWRPSDAPPQTSPPPPGGATSAAEEQTGWRDVTAAPRAEPSTPRLRGGAHASLGAASTVAVFAGGTGFGAELGVQITPWLATSIEGYAETAIGLVGRAHAGALLQIAPLRQLEVGLGGGVTGMYELNFFFPNETASLGVLVLRATVHLPQDGEGLFGARPDRWDLFFGAHGEAGWVFDGTRRDAEERPRPQEVGALGGGGRLLVGFLL